MLLVRCDTIGIWPTQMLWRSVLACSYGQKGKEPNVPACWIQDLARKLRKRQLCIPSPPLGDHSKPVKAAASSLLEASLSHPFRHFSAPTRLNSACCLLGSLPLTDPQETVKAPVTIFCWTLSTEQERPVIPGFPFLLEGRQDEELLVTQAAGTRRAQVCAGQ